MWEFTFIFDAEKLVQASAVILRRQHAQRMNYMKLLKLLYIADRESIAETGRPITGDCPVAMERGPVLSRTLDIINGLSLESDQWERFIRRAEDQSYEVEIISDPGRGHLSRYEISKLEEVNSRFADKDEWAMVQWTHKQLEEWIANDPGTSSKRIPLRDILEAVGVADQADEIIDEARAAARFDQFFKTAQ